MQELVKFHRPFLHLSNIPLLCSPQCLFLGLKTSSSSLALRQNKTSNSRRKRATEPKEQSSKRKTKNSSLSIRQEMDSVEETEPSSNQLCSLSEEMKCYVKWMQDGLLTEEACRKQCESSLPEQDADVVSKEKTDPRIHLSRWQELFQLPSARYQSLDDERLLLLNKSAPSMTRVLLLMENTFSKNNQLH
ncbi:hypothetical protein GpartN1_g7500.t1 [Galdieria partita]|uniref:Uncharacterized protein n=1 Tax=Galdieria partita TaxID=83374 RepID=A0A9C7Q4T0_9RHOD|nr:hypothetical protein GpartN1_g7500.t1 [Galdieria partita]